MSKNLIHFISDTVQSSQYTDTSTRSKLTVIPSYEPNTSEEPIVTDSAVKEVTSSPMVRPVLYS